MRSPLETYFDTLINFGCADDTCGDVNEIGHFALFTGDLTVLRCNAWNDLPLDDKRQVREHKGAIVKTDEQGFIDVTLYHTAGEARKEYERIEHNCHHYTLLVDDGLVVDEDAP